MKKRKSCTFKVDKNQQDNVLMLMEKVFFEDTQGILLHVLVVQRLLKMFLKKWKTLHLSAVSAEDVENYYLTT